MGNLVFGIKCGKCPFIIIYSKIDNQKYFKVKTFNTDLKAS